MNEKHGSHEPQKISRRSFLRDIGVAGAKLFASAAIPPNTALASERVSHQSTDPQPSTPTETSTPYRLDASEFADFLRGAQLPQMTKEDDYGRIAQNDLRIAFEATEAMRELANVGNAEALKAINFSFDDPLIRDVPGIKNAVMHADNGILSGLADMGFVSPVVTPFMDRYAIGDPRDGADHGSITLLTMMGMFEGQSFGPAANHIAGIESANVWNTEELPNGSTVVPINYTREMFAKCAGITGPNIIGCSLYSLYTTDLRDKDGVDVTTPWDKASEPPRNVAEAYELFCDKKGLIIGTNGNNGDGSGYGTHLARYARRENTLMVGSLDQVVGIDSAGKRYAKPIMKPASYVSWKDTGYAEDQARILPYEHMIFAPGYSFTPTVPKDPNNPDKISFTLGTSVAQPLVTAVANICQAIHPGLSGVEIKSILLQTATPHDIVGNSTADRILRIRFPQGFRVLNAHAAFELTTNIKKLTQKNYMPLTKQDSR